MKTTIDMAREAGFQVDQGALLRIYLERFEALIRADERERVMNEPLTKAQWQRFEDEIRADEREACAKVCEELPLVEGAKQMQRATLKDAAAAIRARGELK